MPNVYEEKLHLLMFTLLYPAVLGTMIVGVVFAWTDGRLFCEDKFQWLTSFWSLFILVYFSSQHVENSKFESNYSCLSFVLDFIECGVIISLFLILGIYPFEPSILNGDLSVSVCFFGLLVVAFLIPLINRLFKEKGNYTSRLFCPENKLKSCLSIVAILVAALGFILGYEASCVLLIFLTILLVIYLWNISVV